MPRTKPRKERDYYFTLKRIVLWVLENLTAKDFDSTFVLKRFKPDFDDYEYWYLICEDSATRTPDALKNKAQAWKVVDVSFSIMIEMIKLNLLTTDAERINIGIAINKGSGGKAVPPPDTFPEFFLKMLKAQAPGRLVLMYKDLGHKLEGRPPHVSHMEYRYLIADEFVTEIELLTEQGIDTASPITFHRPSEDRGKKLSIAGRWVSNGGEAGDWGPVVGFIIP
jgi:hypothetical protein